MSSFTPYTYIQCPCTENSISSPSSLTESPPSPTDEDDRTFDPRGPRANYSLYPLEQLLYCEDCHQIRCPRCVLDEIVTWYCPTCLFEVPSSTVKSEGNRCTRNCFQCPSCTAPLLVSSVEAPPTGLGVDQVQQSGPYVLNCNFCHWNSKEIGIQIEKPTGVFHQLAKIKNGGGRHITVKERRREENREISDITEESNVSELALDPTEVLDAETQFSNLKTFYQSQLAVSAPAGALGFTGDYGYGSPGALSRIMGLYTGGGGGGGGFVDKKAPKPKPSNMREASNALEGLQITQPYTSDGVSKLLHEGWESTASAAQRKEQLHDPQFLSDARPIPMLLRTKRSKRCKECRHILSKPESKVQNIRFRIRLIALNYIPSISIKPLQPSSAQPLLTPLKPTQFVLTFKNPLFESVKVNIATPASTPGRFASKVTVLCPQFEVDANTDVWDEALREGGASATREKRRTRAETSEGQHQAEAGKVWERGRNWVSVVVEVVPASLRMDGPAFIKSEEQKKDDGPLREDEDVLEIPVFVRVEWETDAQQEGGLAVKGEGKEVKEKRELAYWCVLGVGRIAQD